MDHDIAKDETAALISSNKVEGTAVYNSCGERLGSIYNFMVDKLSGQVRYAVLSFGGFMGLGEDYYPLPWNTLTYDTRLNGYVVDLSREQLEDAPHFDSEHEPDYSRDYGQRVHSHYGQPYSI